MKTLIVIGAGKNLGNGVAEKFAKEGFRIILIARSEENLKQYKSKFETQGFDVITQQGDVSNFKEFASIFNTVIEKYGTPDIIFYNVGNTSPDISAKITAKTLVERYKGDVAGAYNVIKLIDTKEFSDKKGAILITGGIFGISPSADYLPLSMDKAALRIMVSALSPVLKKKNIFLGMVTVTGEIGSTEYFSPISIAESFWKLYQNRDNWEYQH